MDLLTLIARNVIVMESSMVPPSPEHVPDDHSPIWRPPHSTCYGKRPSPIPEERDSIHRRYSHGDLVTAGQPDKECYSLLQRQSSVSDFRHVSWSEYTARRSLAKFRNRHSATYRSRDQHGSMPPSEMAVRVLCNQYEVCRNKQTQLSERIMAVFYCWFFGWITDVYSSLTHGGAERSFLKWLLSSLLVTLGATVLVGIVCVLAHGLLLALTRLLHSAITFSAFLVAAFLAMLGIVTIMSYSKFHGSGRHSVRMRYAIRKLEK